MAPVTSTFCTLISYYFFTSHTNSKLIASVITLIIILFKCDDGATNLFFADGKLNFAVDLQKIERFNMRKKPLKVIGFGAIAGLILSMMGTLPSQAALSGVSVDFAGAQPTTYSHLTGGGSWNAGTVNVDIARSLEGESFACRDVVSYLTRISIANSSELRGYGAMTAQVSYAFDLDTTGQSGVSLNVPISAVINSSTDSSTQGDGNSQVSLVSTSTTGPEFTSGSKLLATFNITDLEANETVVMRINVKIGCKSGASPTGNLQAKLVDANMIYKNGTTPFSPVQAFGSGSKTIDLKSVDLLAKPMLKIEKTVTFPELSCPGTESVTIEPDQYVKYCYKVTNPSNIGNSPGANLYNVSVINDDSGEYPDFTVTLTSGLTDLDSDGQADDLAPGAIALGEKVIAFDGDKDTTLVNTAVITGEDAPTGGATLTASDTASVFIDAPEPVPGISIEKTPETQNVIEGNTATFSISVVNTGNVALTSVVVSDAATPSCDNSWSTLAAGATVTYSCTTSALTAPLTNVAVVNGYYLTTPLTASDTATVSIDYLPKIEVSKSASVESLPETGGAVTFTVVVKNLAVEAFSLASLTDDIFGDLDGVGTCDVPQTIAVAGEYSCSFTKTLAPFTLTPHKNTVTATGTDPEGHQTSANDDATVTFTDVLPDISLDKTVNPTAARWTGDYVDYHFVISNLTLEPVTIDSFVDNAVTLSPQCLALIGTTIAANSSVECWIYSHYITGVAGESFTNTATVVGKDNEGNSDTATDSAVVNFWWYGRTPGYWKNHPEAWISGYLPGAYVQNVFTIPTGLLTGSILDLDKNGAKDTLIAGLAYKGGSTVAGGAQILMRAAIAALLNKAYYGGDYPAASSKAALITMVNNALATMDRAQIIALASYFDYWNNANHASLP